MIDLPRALSYPFSGRDALVNTVIGALMVLLTPVFFLTGFVLLGYQLRAIRGVMDDPHSELPDWDRFGDDFIQGIMVFLGSLIYYLPSFILAGLGAALMWDIVSGVSLVDLVLHRENLDLDRSKLSMMLLCFTLALIWLVLTAPLMMAAIARYAETGQFSAFTHVLDRADEAWAQRGVAARLMLSLFVLTILAHAVSALLAVTCLIGLYIQFVQFAAVCHLNGQWGAHLKANRPAPSVIRPLKPRQP
ncbi:MAG: DUF4013 domain-containing protein [Anaerolineae bacterium]|nr:DUF4013 domain-containing protein [Anaerolineae bacterium]